LLVRPPLLPLLPAFIKITGVADWLADFGGIWRSGYVRGGASANVAFCTRGSFTLPAFIL
ncbi:MAG TPA: hypothetical protein PLS55_15825, partial [Thermogutta sp.]|nr:hypothetical protein [Thermogutta sp.]